MSAKLRKVSYPSLSLFWTYFHKMGSLLSRWAYYFLRSKNNVNFTKKKGFLERVFMHIAYCTVQHMQLCIYKEVIAL